MFPYFVFFAIRFIKGFLKSVSCNTFFFFKGIAQVYLLKISITLDKKRIPSLNLLINYISTRSAPQVLSIKVEYTLHFSNFLIIGLCIFLASSWFNMFLF